ncbi:hypothetical protein UFOVP157_20 [uncultured Caudovirales phage]|uniref:Uncharacterized protein n=1 Tax=uncultured Caudovirales phage TaxID=2100421 RepID=A0A6J7WDC0_9CAUD|nr:hypothetical protein UFOVP157_20 [uncultured Caudovirales phage]
MQPPEWEDDDSDCEDLEQDQLIWLSVQHRIQFFLLRLRMI